MHQLNKEIQKHYEGFLQTNSLWEGNSVFNLHQFSIDSKSTRINIDINEKLRLGKYIERLVSFQLNEEENISILCENIQIQREKITLGELDCIIKRGNQTIHLEVIYKFYLYDTSVGNTEIEHCIGPNRKDSLLEKLTKLKDKQLPLLYSKECINYLTSINLHKTKIQQQVYFKGQLFIPFSQKNLTLKEINQDCISGYYINQNEVTNFKNCKFYLPNKKNWIVVPHKNVNWQTYLDIKETIEEYNQKKTSPLCWIKKQNGEIIKVFIVWW